MGSSHLYPEIDPYLHGHMEVGDGNRIYWECCGTPSGKAAVVLHGGPGSGCSPWHRRLFDPSAYRVVLFDQRNCGRSTPNASLQGTDLANNTTTHLVHDIEQLRCHLSIQHWFLRGGSWGSTLALAYAETHPDCVTEIILFGVTTGRRNEFDWLFGGGLALAALTAAGSAPQAVAQTPIKVSYQPALYWSLPYYVATENKFWADAGLVPEFSTFPAGAPQVAAAQAKAWDVGGTGVPHPQLPGSWSSFQMVFISASTTWTNTR